MNLFDDDFRKSCEEDWGVEIDSEELQTTRSLIRRVILRYGRSEVDDVFKKPGLVRFRRSIDVWRAAADAPPDSDARNLVAVASDDGWIVQGPNGEWVPLGETGLKIGDFVWIDPDAPPDGEPTAAE